MLLQAFPPSSHRPIRHPDDLRCFPPGDPLRHRLQQHVLQFHHPLHIGPGIRSARFQSLASRSSSLLKRTHHLLIRPDRSYVNDKDPVSSLTLTALRLTVETTANKPEGRRRTCSNSSRALLPIFFLCL